ncbi:MAG: capsule assembly Wzi family protein [Bacteroidota bacterium]
MPSKVFILILPIFFYTVAVQGQADSLRIMIESKYAVATGDALPHWLAFNQFGFFESGESNGYLRAEIKKGLFKTKDFEMTTEVDFLGRTAGDHFLLHEAYLNLEWKQFDLQIGLNEPRNSDFPDDLSMGHLVTSRNAPTIPKITAGFLEYVDVPLTKGFLQVKGVLAQGILEEDRVVERALYHEKWAYLRTQKLPINLYAGFANVALFGGELNGVKQSNNYWDVFFGRRSSTSNVNGDSVNAAGAHYGIFDYGAQIETDDISINVYYQQPWEDGTSLKNFSAINKDYQIGIHLVLKGQQWVSEILYENLNSEHQSGEGLPDPYINGVGYNFDDLRAIENYDQFLEDELGITTSGVTFEEFIDIIRFETNNNLEWGGRDSYYVNRGYPDGNTHKRFTIGNSLFLTSDRVFEMTGFQALDASRIVNNRIRAQHFGVKGNIVPWDVDYRLLVTFTHNSGTYAGKYGGNINSWNLNREYFFRDGVNSDYLRLDLSKELEKTPMALNLALAFDQRGFGQYFGFLVGAKYTWR